jgi:hypothetical protein
MSAATTMLLAAVLAGAPNMPKGWKWPPTTTMKAVGAGCLKRLDAAGVQWQRGAATKKIVTPVVVPGMTIGEIALVSLRKGGGATMDCHLAAAIAEVAPALRALGVTSLQFRTLHRYRNVRKKGKRTRILSRHALGLAVDVFAVGFEDGEVLWVEKDWRGAGRRLPQVAAVFAGSEAFRTPLTPANDPGDHGDHVHLEAHMRLTEK